MKFLVGFLFGICLSFLVTLVLEVVAIYQYEQARQQVRIEITPDIQGF